MTEVPELPNNPWGNDLQELVRFVAQYDFVVLQRTYNLYVMRQIRKACDILRKPLIYETDDDYLHIPESNDASKEINNPKVMAEYLEILRLADAITVSTEQLKKVLYPYNKNIKVFPNNLEQIGCGEWGEPCKAYLKQEQEDNRVVMLNRHGMVGVPAFMEKIYIDDYLKKEVKREKIRTLRVGYTGTPSHKEDFETIRHTLDKLMDKFHMKIWMVFIGDKYFYNLLSKGRGRVVAIDSSKYHTYMQHIRNLDIGLAPLTPNIFNMSKSPIKALEYASWGVPAVLPNYITYNREFTNEKNCLMYNNSREFGECLEEMLNNDELRLRLGKNARDHVQQNRLERDHAKERYEFYKGLVDSMPKFKMFYPKKGE